MRKRWIWTGRRASVRRDVDAELHFHLAERVDELVRGGQGRDRAERQALREFGDVARAREELVSLDHARLRQRTIRDGVATLGDDLRAALRGVARGRGFALTVVATLAVGIAASASMFSLIDRLLLRAAPHVREADRLGIVYHQTDVPAMGRITQTSRSYLDLAAVRADTLSFDAVGGFFSADWPVGRGAEARETPVMLADAGFFRALGVAPHAGRFFLERESGTVRHDVAVISFAYWQQAFGGRADALGQTVFFQGRSHVVVGIAPPGFRGIGLEPVSIFAPLETFGARDSEWVTNTSWQWIHVVARRRHGVTREQAEQRLTATFRELHREDQYERDGQVFLGSVLPGRAPEAGGEGRVSLLLFIVSMLVLAIATANVANLMLHRAARRQREVAVRLALGVPWARLTRQLVLEGWVLALLATLVALAGARWFGEAIRVLLLPEVDRTEVVVDPRVVLAAALVSSVCGVLIGVVPALAARAADLTRDLRTGARDGGHRRGALRHGLLITQAALSLTLLVGAVLFARSLQRAVSVELGFDADAVHVVEPDLNSAGIADAARARYFDDLVEHVRGLPGVQGASLATTVPFWMNQSVRLRVEGLDSLPPLRDGTPSITSADTAWFHTMGIRILRGRAFDATDGAGAPRVTVINENMRRQLFGEQDPIGRCLFIGSDPAAPCTRVVGVMTSARRWSIAADDRSAQYVVPLSQRPPTGSLALLVRIERPTTGLVRELAQGVQRFDSRVPLPTLRTLRSIVAPHVRPFRVGASVLVAFGVVALLLAAVGLYSVVAYDTAQRRHELGIRSALGANAADVARLVVAAGLKSAGWGIGLGLVVALAAAPRVQSLLFEVSARDPVLLSAAAALLLLVTAVATLIPAWRASRADPLDALRAD
jgi:predicted permease